MPYSLTQLTQFVAVVEEGTFTAAAARLRVAQPWLSTRVRLLEEMIGFRLLDRSPRGVSLTAEGREFFDGALAVLRENAELQALVARIAQGKGRQLRIGAIVETFYVSERNRLIDAFKGAYPTVEVRLENYPAPELLRLLQRGDLDAVFVSGRPPPRLDAVRLRRGHAELAMPLDHPLAGMDAVPVEAVKGWRIGVFPRWRNPASWDQSIGPLQAAGALLETWTETLRDALIAEARRKNMMTVLLSSFGDRDSGLDGMCLRPIAEKTIGADFFLIRRAAGLRDAALDRFWRLAESFAV